MQLRSVPDRILPPASAAAVPVSLPSYPKAHPFYPSIPPCRPRRLKAITALSASPDPATSSTRRLNFLPPSPTEATANYRMSRWFPLGIWMRSWRLEEGRACLNVTACRIYKWMVQRPWDLLGFALATKLLDYLGKDRKPDKCRDLFNDIINPGRVPSESTIADCVLFERICFEGLHKDGDAEEAEKARIKLHHIGGPLPSQAYVYKMEVPAKDGDFNKSLETFREMKKRLGSANVVAYHKIINSV
ncbi:hypothetical protein MLD38_022987 [Melastoma candidum]|uniref:Uncharacterized protein n=1 Tax=Melastoma candidum TaxID=119954 RepID=A0ACB9QM98_9MYRT|nr:hypothetical protein MLD38_022987 [Melastoma candidum]